MSLPQCCWYRNFLLMLALSQPLEQSQSGDWLYHYNFTAKHQKNVTTETNIETWDLIWTECWFIFHIYSLASAISPVIKANNNKFWWENIFIHVFCIVFLVSAGSQFSIVVIIQGVEGIITIFRQILYFLDVTSFKNLKSFASQSQTLWSLHFDPRLRLACLICTIHPICPKYKFLIPVMMTFSLW